MRITIDIFCSIVLVYSAANIAVRLHKTVKPVSYIVSPSEEMSRVLIQPSGDIHCTCHQL